MALHLLYLPARALQAMKRRQVEIAVISDVHLGTYGCHAAELIAYLRKLDPKVLVLNGDIIDIWQFNKRYWPKAHMQVLKEFMKILARGTKVYYVTGNHDEMLRKFSPFSLGNFLLVDRLELPVGDKKAWIIHGDVFDASMQYAKWLAKLGGVAYDLLIMFNRVVNWVLVRMGRGKMSLSKQIKNSVKTAVRYISDFEGMIANTAVEAGYDYVICGHIHQPQIAMLSTPKGAISYLNSGDWIENLTALEYANAEWTIYHHDPADKTPDAEMETPEDAEEDVFVQVAEGLFSGAISTKLTPQKHESLPLK